MLRLLTGLTILFGAKCENNSRLYHSQSVTQSSRPCKKHDVDSQHDHMKHEFSSFNHWPAFSHLVPPKAHFDESPMVQHIQDLQRFLRCIWWSTVRHMKVHKFWPALLSSPHRCCRTDDVTTSYWRTSPSTATSIERANYNQMAKNGKGTSIFFIPDSVAPHARAS